jgi:hypothetical protein
MQAFEHAIALHAFAAGIAALRNGADFQSRAVQERWREFGR